MLTSRSSIALLVGALSLVACTSETSTTTPSTEPSGTGTGTGTETGNTETSGDTTTTPPTTPPTTTPPTTTPPTSNSCNVIVNDADVVGASMVAADAPAPTGGAITAGTYHLKKISVFTGVGGAAGPLQLAIKQTFAIQGNSADVIQDANGTETRLTSSLTTTGTAVSFARTCPSPEPGKTGSYSAKPGSLVLFLQNDVNQTVSYEYAP